MEQIEDREAMLQRRAELLAAHPEIRLAAELGPLMGEYQMEYWKWSLEQAVHEIRGLRGPRYIEVKGNRAV